MIREAGYDDIEDIVKNGALFHKYALENKGLKYDPKDTGKTIKWLIDNDNTIVFISENEGIFCGCIAGILSPWILDHSQWILMEQFWWVNPEQRKGAHAVRLVNKLIEWGKSKGAELMIMVSMNIETEKYYKKNDFMYSETHFIKRI